MRLQSLIPFREPGMLTRPDFGLFGLHREIDRLFSEFAQGLGPSGAKIIPNIEISETDKTIEVSAEMPGLERKEVEISIEDDTLTIRGEKKVEEGQKELHDDVTHMRMDGAGLEVARDDAARLAVDDDQVQKDKNVQLSERSYGVFYRVLQLPPGIDPSSIQATMSNGILKVTIPKPAKSEPKKIEVKEAA